MKSKANLNAQNILNKKFKANVKGYDCHEVDDFLDLIINDYKDFSKKIEERNEYITKLETTINDLRKTQRELELIKARYEERFGNIKSDQKVSLQTSNILSTLTSLKKSYALGVDPRS